VEVDEEMTLVEVDCAMVVDVVDGALDVVVVSSACGRAIAGIRYPEPARSDDSPSALWKTDGTPLASVSSGLFKVSNGRVVVGIVCSYSVCACNRAASFASTLSKHVAEFSVRRFASSVEPQAARTSVDTMTRAIDLDGETRTLSPFETYQD
jgi:hypothetical protein